MMINDNKLNAISKQFSQGDCFCKNKLNLVICTSLTDLIHYPLQYITTYWAEFKTVTITFFSELLAPSEDSCDAILYHTLTAISDATHICKIC